MSSKTFSSSRPDRRAHKPQNLLISRSGHGEHLIAGGRPGLAESHKLCLVGFDSQATQPFSRMQPRTTLSRPGNTCRLSDAPWTSTSSLTGSLRGANPTWSNHLCGVRMDCQSLSCLYGKKVTKRAKVLGAANNPQRRQILSQGGGSRRIGVNTDVGPTESCSQHGVQVSNPAPATTLACGTTLPARGYSFSTAALRFPRHSNLVSGAKRGSGVCGIPVGTCCGLVPAETSRPTPTAYHSLWQSEMRSHPFPKVRVGAAYKEEGTRFARHPFQIVAP